MLISFSIHINQSNYHLIGIKFNHIHSLDECKLVMCLKYKQNEYVKENEKAPERQFIWTGEQISRLKDHKIILEKKK